MVKKIDTSLPVGKQLDLLDKLGQSLRKAAETALIDKGAVGEFAERLFKPSLDQVIQKLRSKAGLSGEAMQKKALDEMRLPAIGCFVAGTLVHTKDGLKPIEQIKIGDWVLSRPESPEQGTETGYKRVTKTFRFEDKEVVRFWWAPNSQAAWEQTEWVYATPNHPVWLNPHGWVAMGRLHLPGKLRPGTIHRGDDEWLSRELILADGSSGAMLDVMDLFCTDQQEVAFLEDDDPDWGVLVDFSCPVARIIPEELAYDYEKWGDPTNETRARYTTTVYNFEVEDWHTYFVGRMGVWVHNTNCLEATLEVAPGKGDIDQLLTGVLQVGSQAHKFKTLSRADLNDFLRKNPNAKQGVAVVKMDGAGKYDKFELGADDLPNGLKFEDEGLGRLIDKSTGTRYEYAVLIDPSSWSGQSLGTNLASRLSQARYVKLENSYFTKNGTRVFVDRKFDTTSMSNAALKYKPLDQLFRLALAAKSNPGMRFAIEVSKDGKNALPAFTKLLDDIRFNRISGEIRTGSGVLRYTADDTKFVLDMIRTHLLKLDADGKQVLQLLVENTISRTSPFPQNVIAEGTGLSPETLDLAHVYLQLAQARQYWLDQGASAARLNQASFAIANLPSGWAARTDGTQITLDASGAGWGWFVDPSPEEHSAFVPASADPAVQATQADYSATPGSQAEGKLDLLTVLIQLLRYCARPPFAMDRLRKEGSKLVYRCAKQRSEPTSDKRGAKADELHLTPLELIDRIAALVPPPRTHRHRYFGVLAPNSPLRAAVTALATPAQAAPVLGASISTGECAPGVVPMSSALPSQSEPVLPKRAAHYLWAVLIARIYEVFPLLCPLCGGHMRIIAFITHSADIRHILDHIGADSEPPRISPARGPPLWDDCSDAQMDDGAQTEPADWDLAAQPAPDFEVDQRISW